MTNMTWWDHETESIWVQMTGRAARGPLSGATLQQIPAFTGPWAAWLAEHPETQVLVASAGVFGIFREQPQNDFVVGVTLEGDASAYYYEYLAERRIVQDVVADVPILVLADPDTRSIRAFARVVGGESLTFELTEGKLRDLESGTIWNPLTGLGETGPNKGALLRQIPYTPAFDWSWRDFYPESRFFPEYGG